MLASDLSAQDNPLDAFTWKHRILLLITDSDSNTSYLEQRDALGDLDSEFDDRKLLVLQVLKKQIDILNPPDKEGYSEVLTTNESLYSDYNIAEEDFSVVLIGLDGGIKLQQAETLSRKDLFDRIDSMPMRRAEMRKKN